MQQGDMQAGREGGRQEAGRHKGKENGIQAIK